MHRFSHKDVYLPVLCIEYINQGTTESPVEKGIGYIKNGMKVKVIVLVAQSCLTLCDPMDCSLPGSSVH